MQAKDKGVGFAVWRGDENITAEQLNEPVGNDVIRIAPVIMGSKRAGVLNVILGAVIVVVTAFLDVWTEGGFSSATGGAGYTLGFGMIAGGVIQLLTPVPRGTKNKSTDNEPSYTFNGAVNTQA